MASGTVTRDTAGTTTWPAKPPNPQNTRTRSPTARSVTPGPRAVTTPATSLPETNGVGGLSWYFPWQISPSTKLTPAAATSMTTMPSAGSGVERSSTTRVSNGPNSVQTMARMAATLVGTCRRTHGRARSRSRRTTPPKAAAKASTSAAVVDHPTDTRSERSPSTPMAWSTGDGSSDSDEHDDPE